MNRYHQARKIYLLYLCALRRVAKENLYSQNAFLLLKEEQKQLINIRRMRHA